MKDRRPFDETLVALRLAVGQELLSGKEAESHLGRVIDGHASQASVPESLEADGRLDAQGKASFERDLEFCFVRREDRLFGKIAVVRGLVEPERVDRFLAEQRCRFEEGRIYGRLHDAIFEKGLLGERTRGVILRLRNEILEERYGRPGSPRYVTAEEDEVDEQPIAETIARPRWRRKDCPSCGETVGGKEMTCPVCSSRLHLGVRRRLRLPRLRGLGGQIARTMRLRVDVLGHEVYPVLQRAAIVVSLSLLVFFSFRWVNREPVPI